MDIKIHWYAEWTAANIKCDPKMKVPVVSVCTCRTLTEKQVSYLRLMVPARREAWRIFWCSLRRTAASFWSGTRERRWKIALEISSSMLHCWHVHGTCWPQRRINLWMVKFCHNRACVVLLKSYPGSMGLQKWLRVLIHNFIWILENPARFFWMTTKSIR